MTAERKLELAEEQTRLLERFRPEFRERHIEAPHTGSLVAVDTFFVGTLKGVGKVYLQTAIDCHSRYAWALVGLIDIVVNDGVVKLGGALTDERERQAIRVAAENIAGVKKVEDHLI